MSSVNKFQISLDRQSGVFYAGEVITGTLHVMPSKNETCRSLLLSMVGKARVHWHTGSGDNRNDYYGKKIFLQSNRTLWGNFYRTALLDEAGEDAEFGAAVGDGTMYIPCLATEGSNGSSMKLIVRVCDYDWGKRDDNIGEIVIDAKELALKGDAMTYDLTRNGKPEKGTITLAAMFMPSSAIALDAASGASSQSSETLVLKVLRANGLRKADWIGKNDVYVQVWRAPDEMPQVGKKLPEPEMKISLPDGPLSFKFAFPTREDSPGSAVLNCGDSAYIAYYIKAEIDKKGWRNPSLKYPVTILPSRPVPMLPLLSPSLTEEEDEIKKMKFCCFACGKAGLVTIKLQTGRRAYAPGETIRLHGSQVLNASTIPVTVQVVLRQHIQLSTTGVHAITTRGCQRFHLAQKEIGPESSLYLDELLPVVPAVPPSFFGAQGLSTARREPLIYTYELSLQAKAKSGHKVKVDVPILVSALPPKPEAIQEASTAVNTLSIGSLYEIQNFAVTDNSPCDTVIMATGLEDNQGVIVPSITGSTNIYEIEDSGSSTNFYDYHPQVVTFSSPTGAVDNDMVTISPQQNTVEIDRRKAYDLLLERMAMEYDARLTVDKWIKEYPKAASKLSADEFAGVLKKVLLSLEQAAVARELTNGMGKDALTTKHITAAMEACPYSKLDIVRVMAPYVRDPENKEDVLSSLYSFERSDASKLFAR